MVKSLLTILAASLAIETPLIMPKANSSSATPNMSVTKRTLTASEAKQMALSLGFSFNNKSDLKNNYGQYLVDDGSYITSDFFETNKHYSYSAFTGYIFTNNNEIAETKVTIGSFVSESICVSSTVGVYEKVSYGVDVELAEEIGVSNTITHTVTIDQTFSLSGKANGTYGLMMRFYTCDKLYLKFSGSAISGGLLVSNNPSATYSYSFVRRGA
ncbi:MAG: hypothetical protein MJ228_00460 [Bacilli bacterium]|nr:hypothetical protein [Bacilli bacterium]